MNPQQSLERAVYTFAVAHTFTGIESTSIYKGLDNPTEVDDAEQTGTPNRVHPSLTIIADGSHEEVCLGTKVYRGNLVLRIEADAQNTTDADFNTLCFAAFRVFDINELKEEISSLTEDFTCLQANIVDNGRAINNGINWQNEMIIDCVYAQADL
jgi:hypothetical protein